MTKTMVSDQKSVDLQASVQFSTFVVHKRLYGIDVTKVQEVVKAMPITPVPHSPKYVVGLINLRGQIATAIGVMELFDLKKSSRPDMMNIVCNVENNLIALQVDEIGDVMEVQVSDFEVAPSTLPEKIRKLLAGVYKTDGALLSVIDLTKVAECLGIKKIK